MSAVCATCGYEFVAGDRFIEAPSSEFLGRDAEPEVDAVMSDIFGGADGCIRLCASCTESGGPYEVKTFA